MNDSICPKCARQSVEIDVLSMKAKALADMLEWALEWTESPMEPCGHIPNYDHDAVLKPWMEKERAAMAILKQFREEEGQ